MHYAPIGLPPPRTKQEVMRDVEVIRVENQQREGVIPRETGQQPVGHSRNHTAHGDNGPQPAHDPHIAKLVTLVGLLVSRRGPQQLDAEETILDGREVRVRLHYHDMLHVEAVLCFGPEAEEQRAIDDGRDGEG